MLRTTSDIIERRVNMSKTMKIAGSAPSPPPIRIDHADQFKRTAPHHDNPRHPQGPSKNPLGDGWPYKSLSALRSDLLDMMGLNGRTTTVTDGGGRWAIETPLTYYAGLRASFSPLTRHISTIRNLCRSFHAAIPWSAYQLYELNTSTGGQTPFLDDKTALSCQTTYVRSRKASWTSSMTPSAAIHPHLHSLDIVEHDVHC
ncbi:hypothetical protein BD410DRAFT_624250 [Rickenella mellea]|uniref:Uncharacterized protein n=1 Tax=Rickenella mellea TaxID=50990 RepID=A0A4Y7PP97_9AGAM|nr:hypothetical protein BD410DRAFT_624250 [Rickenella mellea]